MKKSFKFSNIFLILLAILLATSVFFLFPKTEHWVPLEPTNTVDSDETGDIEESKATIIFVGDMMFDRYIRKIGETRGYDFLLSKMREKLSVADLVVGNLEGPITENESVSLPAIRQPENFDHFTFTFDPSVAEVLRENNIHLVSLANNHSMNFGAEGLGATKQFLTNAGVEYFGDPRDPAKPHIEEINGLTFAFIGWNAFGARDLGKTLESIKRAEKKADWVIVYPHWGVEYQKKPTDNMRKLARAFIDSGADLVVGAHPHVIGTTETYREKRIYYSLGNFVFDQYFQPEVRCGLILFATFTENEITYSSQKTYLKETGQTIPAPFSKCTTPK